MQSAPLVDTLCDRVLLIVCETKPSLTAAAEHQCHRSSEGRQPTFVAAARVRIFSVALTKPLAPRRICLSRKGGLFIQEGGFIIPWFGPNRGGVINPMVGYQDHWLW